MLAVSPPGVKSGVKTFPRLAVDWGTGCRLLLAYLSLNTYIISKTVLQKQMAPARIYRLTNRTESAIINPTRNFNQGSRSYDYYLVPSRPPSLYPSSAR